jgi:hypothetical protein
MRAAAKRLDQNIDRAPKAVSPSKLFRFSEIDRLESRRIVLLREVERYETELTILAERGARKDDPRCVRIRMQLDALALENAQILQDMSNLQPSNAREIGIMLTALSHHLHVLIKSMRGDDDETSRWEQGENCQRILSGIRSAYVAK